MRYPALRLTVAVMALGLLTNRAAADPILTYHMDELRGLWVIDSTGNGNNASLGNGAVHTDDAVTGRAVSTESLGGVITAPDSASLDSITGGITVEGWFKLTSDPDINTTYNNYRELFSKGGRGGPWDMVLEQSRASQWSVKVDSGSGTVEYRFYSGSASFNVGEWTHFAYTYDAATGQMGIYKNGVGYFSNKTPAPLITNNSSFQISYGNTDPNQNGQGFAPGIFDEVAVYSHALTSAEVLARYSDGPPAPAQPASPVADVAVWHFDEGSGTTARDSTVGGHNGTLSGGATWGGGMYASAVHFDGVNGRMQAPLPAAESPTKGVTVEGWFYLDQDPNVDSQNNWRWIFNDGGWATPFDCILEQGRNMTFSIALDTATQYRWGTGFTMPLDEWVHMAWTYDAETGMMKAYFNGAENSHYIGTTGDLGVNDLNFALSAASSAFPNGNGAFPGFMDEVALYSRALTHDEILARYAFGAPVALPEPGTLTLAAIGLGFLALVRFARRKKSA